MTAALIAVCVLAGYAFAKPGPRKTQHASIAALRLDYTQPWAEAADPVGTSITGLRFTEQLVLHRSGAVLVAGRLQDVRTSLDPAPAAVRATWVSNAAPAPTHAGDALVYRASLADGQQQVLAMYPVSGGWLAAACQAREEDRVASCASIAAEGTVSAWLARSVRPTVQVARAIDAALAPLSRARSSAQDDLDARSIRTRAAAARSVAAASRAAAAQMKGIDGGPYEAAALRGARVALGREARALDALAHAAMAMRRTSYRRAASEVLASERTLSEQLKDAGYRAFAG